MAFKEVEVDDFGTFVRWGQFGQAVTGVLVLKGEQDTQYGKQKVYSIEDSDTLIAVGGSADINRKLANVEVGQTVRITYTEDLPPTKVGQSPMKCFKVEVDDGQPDPKRGSSSKKPSAPAQQGNDDIPF